MKHDYTNDEIRDAWNHRKYLPGQRGKTLDNLKAFLEALPTRSAEPAEIAALKAALAESERQFQAKVEEVGALLDQRDKAQGILKACLSVMPFGNIETHTAENLPGRIADLASEIASLSLENEQREAELAAMRQSTQSAQPILADDGLSLGRVAFEAWGGDPEEFTCFTSDWQAAAQAVVAAARPAIEAVVLAQAVRRMEAVPVGELHRIWRSETSAGHRDLKAVRARLIAAAKGEGQAQEVPQAESETEKPVWIPHDGGPCPLKNKEVDEWQVKWIDGAVDDYKELAPSHAAGWDGSIIAYRVLKWKPGHGPEAKAEPATKEAPATFQAHGYTWTLENAKAYEDFQDALRETWAAQPTTSPDWTPAVGDTVRLKSGGPVMMVTGISITDAFVCEWFIETNVLCKRGFPAACLTPATP